VYNDFRNSILKCGRHVLIDKAGIPASPVEKDASKGVTDGKAAAGMVGKLEDLQEVASQHGLKFLVYMLDIAWAEAESLRDQQQHQQQPRD